MRWPVGTRTVHVKAVSNWSQRWNCDGAARPGNGQRMQAMEGELEFQSIRVYRHPVESSEDSTEQRRPVNSANHTAWQGTWRWNV
jgi:hypothetical protein